MMSVFIKSNRCDGSLQLMMQVLENCTVRNVYGILAKILGEPWCILLDLLMHFLILGCVYAVLNHYCVCMCVCACVYACVHVSVSSVSACLLCTDHML